MSAIDPKRTWPLPALFLNPIRCPVLKLGGGDEPLHWPVRDLALRSSGRCPEPFSNYDCSMRHGLMKERGVGWQLSSQLPTRSTRHYHQNHGNLPLDAYMCVE